MLLLIILSLAQFTPWNVVETSGAYVTFEDIVGINTTHTTVLVFEREPKNILSARLDYLTVEELGNVILIRANRTENVDTDLITLFESSALKFNLKLGEAQTLIVGRDAASLKTEEVLLGENNSLGTLVVEDASHAGVVGFYRPDETPLNVRIAAQGDLEGAQVDVEEVRNLLTFEIHGNILVARFNTLDVAGVTVPIILGENTLAFLEVVRGEETEVKALRVRNEDE